MARSVREESKVQLAVSMQLPRGTIGAAKGALLHARRIASMSFSYPCRIRGSASICGIPRVMKLSYADSRIPPGPLGSEVAIGPAGRFKKAVPKISKSLSAALELARLQVSENLPNVRWQAPPLGPDS